MDTAMAFVSNPDPTPTPLEAESLPCRTDRQPDAPPPAAENQAEKSKQRNPRTTFPPLKEPTLKQGRKKGPAGTRTPDEIPRSWSKTYPLHQDGEKSGPLPVCSKISAAFANPPPPRTTRKSDRNGRNALSQKDVGRDAEGRPGFAV
jgi:hypothetical protein